MPRHASAIHNRAAAIISAKFRGTSAHTPASVIGTAELPAMHRLLLISALGALVASCDGAPDPVSNVAGNGAAEAVAVNEIPSLRPGLWRTTMIEGSSAGGDAEEYCVEAGVDPIGELGVSDRSNCSKNELHLVGDRYTFDMACENEYANATLKGYFAGDFQKHIVGNLALGLAPPGQPIVPTRYRYESRYVGACSPE